MRFRIRCEHQRIGINRSRKRDPFSDRNNAASLGIRKREKMECRGTAAGKKARAAKKIKKTTKKEAQKFPG